MFVGHYGPSFLAKRLAPSVSLWVLFIAVQLLDVAWALLVFSGSSASASYRDSPRPTRSTSTTCRTRTAFPGPWDGRLEPLLYRGLTGSSRGSVMVGAAVFSHWPLDLLVHRPDLPLYDNSAKVGLGLWHYPYVTLFIEAAVLFGAMGLYLAASRTRTRSGHYAIPVFGAAVLVMQMGMLFTPPPPSDRAMAATALISYVALAAVIGWLERGRIAGAR